MNKCPSCGHENRAGEILCTNCGTNLITGERTHSTKKFDDETRDAAKKEYGEQVLEADAVSDVFPENATLRLEIVGSPLPINVKFARPTLTLGRRDPATGALPDIDLAPFAGYRMGVSRRHSQIRRTDEGYLELFDLGSSNGTFLNGQRLTPHTPYRVNNYDRIALGQIVFQVIYRTATDDALEAAPASAPGKTKELPSAEAPSAEKAKDQAAVKPDVEKAAESPKPEEEKAKPAPVTEITSPLDGKMTKPTFEVIKVEELEDSNKTLDRKDVKDAEALPTALPKTETKASEAKEKEAPVKTEGAAPTVEKDKADKTDESAKAEKVEKADEKSPPAEVAADAPKAEPVAEVKTDSEASVKAEKEAVESGESKDEADKQDASSAKDKDK